MTAYTDYKSERVIRFWDYQRRQHPHVAGIFERPYAVDGRPPVFLPREAGCNVLVDPDASAEERSALLGLVPKAERHRWFGSMGSSQALAQSVFGNLAIRNLLDSLADLHADEDELLFEGADLSAASFTMEHAVSHLGEPRPTSLDGYISGSHRVAIECKFMETDIGTCSRPRLTPKDSHYASGHCSGDYALQQGRSERCALTQAGVRYWRYVPELFTWRNDKDLTPCPLNLNYQLVRNVLAVCTVEETPARHMDGHAVLIYDVRNPTFQAGGIGYAAYQATRAALRNPAMLRRCSWQRLISHVQQQGVLPWLMEQLELKYGLSSAADGG